MTSSPFSLKGKSILVTGASSGIGRAAAKAFAEQGAKVMLWARRSDELKIVLAGLTGEGHGSICVDVGQTTDINDAIKETVLKIGKLSGFFHAAGIEYLRPLALLKDESFDEAMKVAFRAPLMVAKSFTKSSVRDDRGASLVFMSSVASVKGQAAMSLYSATRAAIDASVRSLAVECAGKNLRINSIISGAVETPMHDRITQNIDEKTVEHYRSRHLLGFGKPQDVANAATFLLSDASSWITGTSLVCDGGYTCW